MSPGNISGGREGSISRNIIILQRSKLKLREDEYFDQGNIPWK